MSKEYKIIQPFQYAVMEHGSIKAIRLFNTSDYFGINAEIKTAFGYTFFINWLNPKERMAIFAYGADGYTYIYDERETKQQSWTEI